MSEQLDLLNYVPPPTVPFVRHSETSCAAAVSMAPHTDRLERMVRDALRNKPQTCDELEVLLNLPHQTCSPRLVSMRRKGFARETEEKRATRSGRKAFVWTLTHSGLMAA